jgi:hypothetical protein
MHVPHREHRHSELAKVKRLSRATLVLLEKAVHEFGPSRRRDSPSLHSSMGMEPVIELDICPAIGLYDYLIQLDVSSAQLSDVRVQRRGMGGIIDPVVQLGQAQFASTHDLPTLRVETPADPVQILAVSRALCVRLW